MADRPAPETEIELTPAMIEAGLGAFYAFDRRCDPDEEMIVEIVSATLGASKKPIVQDG